MDVTKRAHAIRATLAIAAALAAASCATDTAPPANPQGVVDQRVAIMKGFAGAIGAAANYSQGKTSAAAAKAKLGPARAGVERIVDLFPRGTALGDRGVRDSRALSTIFANRDDFENKLDALRQRLAALDAALAKSAKSETAKALTAARGACTACHNKYRAPED